MSMTKMDNACSTQADLCELNGDGFYILDALSAGNKALELLSQVCWRCESVLDSHTLGEIEILLEEWN